MPFASVGAGLGAAALAGRVPGTVEGNDLRVYMEGAEGFLLNGNPYGTGFVSPPQFALLLQPWLLLPPDSVGWAWLAAGAFALGITVVGAFRIVGLATMGAWPVLAAVLLLSWPANAYGFELGQNSVLVGMLLTLAGASAVAPTAGALLAFAATMKPHLTLIPLAGLALDEARGARGAKLMATFAATSFGLLALTALYSRHWVDVLMTDPPESWNYLGSTTGLNLFLLAALGDGAAATLTYAVIAVTLVAAIAIWVVNWRPPRPRLLATLLPASLILTPYAYPHDYVILCHSIIWSVAGLIRLRHALAWLLLLGVLAVVWLAPMPARYDEIRFAALAAPTVLLGLAFGLPPAADAKPGA